MSSAFCINSYLCKF